MAKPLRNSRDVEVLLALFTQVLASLICLVMTHRLFDRDFDIRTKQEMELYCHVTELPVNLVRFFTTFVEEGCVVNFLNTQNKSKNLILLNL